jgi:outer membrane biosynthesis protein TonB
MNRLEKKCIVGSATLHGLLLVSFLISSAFQSTKDPFKDMGPVVSLVNPTMTDEMSRGGGNPKSDPNKEAAAPAPQPPQPEPPKQETRKEEQPPEPPKPKPVEPDPPKVKVKERPPQITETEKGDLPVPVKQKKQKETKEKDSPSKPSLTAREMKRTNQDVIEQRKAALEKAQREADAKYQRELSEYRARQRELANSVNGTLGSVGSSIKGGTVVEPFGPGGQAFVNYGSFVRIVYERAWRLTPDLMDDDSVATARVTIRRDGTVVRAVIYERSSNANLNRSVQRALDAVTTIGKSFPESSKDVERTFTIEFNLKTRKAIG